MRRLLRRWRLLRERAYRVRRLSIAEAGDPVPCGEDVLLTRAREAMPRGYEVDAIYEYRHIDSRAAEAWMEGQIGQSGVFRYLPLLGRDCFTFARDALQRAGAPVLLWELYLQRGDGAIPRLGVRARRFRATL